MTTTEAHGDANGKENGPVRRRVIIGALVLLAAFVAAGIYLMLGVRGHLGAARSILSASPADVGAAEIAEANDNLRDASAVLEGLPADFLRLVPVARQNIDAARAAVRTGIPALDSAEVLRAKIDSILDSDLVSGGAVRLESIESLRAPLRSEVEALDGLKTAVADKTSGWLLPPVWDALVDLEDKASELHSTAAGLSDALGVAGPMLGSEGRRTYLVLLMNNAELRGAGGLLSGVGTLTVQDGKLRLGKFLYQGALSETSPGAVADVPEDFARRFDRYRADRRWVNVTASADVPEVGLVATSLYEQTTGVATDGAILIDPRGIAAMMPEDATVNVPGGRTIDASELSDYIYSDSYEELGGSDPRRRLTVLGVGKAAFETVIRGGFGDEDVLRSTSAAIAAGHIRFFAAGADEQRVLEELDVAGELTVDAVDSLHVTMQNLGADKLDFWLDRRIGHRCEVAARVAHCRVRVTIRNEAPRGLPGYVVQAKRSYALYLGYLEIYVPAGADVRGVELDSEAVEFFPEDEDGRTSLGMYVDVPRGQQVAVDVAYDLPLRDGAYSLDVRPQPLAHDATLQVEIEVPAGWVMEGPSGDVRGPLHHEGPLDASFRMTAGPEPDRAGIPALWERLAEFWTEPVL